MLDTAFNNYNDNPWPKAPENTPAPRGLRRRRRLDRDMLAHAAGHMAQSRRFKSAAAAAAAGNIDVHKNYANMVEEEHMQKYVRSTLDAFRGCKQLHMSTDGSSVGTESIVATALHNPLNQQSCWACPQVQRCVLQLIRLQVATCSFVQICTIPCVSAHFRSFLFFTCFDIFVQNRSLSHKNFRLCAFCFLQLLTLTSVVTQP